MAGFATFVSSGFQIAIGSAAGDDTQFTVIGPDGLVQTYFGSGFTYSDGVVTGGIIDGTSLSIDGVPQYGIDGATVLAQFVGEALLNGDAETIRQLLMSASDGINGAAGDDFLNGYDGDDTISGGDGNDTLVGGPGTDVLDGGDGDDVFLIAAGADHALFELIHGGAGTDVIRFTSTTPGDQFFPNFGWFPGIGMTGVEMVVISDAAGDTSGTTALSVNARFVIGFGLTIVGNDGANFLAGTILDDSIFGNGGDDTLSGGAGDDALDGGAGTDTFIIDGSPGSVTVNLAAGFALDGGGGTDTLAGIENAEGSDNGDTLIGDGGANRLRGLAGNDRLDGGAGDDLLDGGDGIDTADYAAHFASIVADLVSDTVSDGFDTDTLVSIENLRGSQASDFLQGDAGANLLDGGDGDDFIAGTGGDDTLIGGRGTDRLDGGDGDDVFLFASGADYATDEQIHGGAGTDAIRFTSTTPGDFLLLGPAPFSDDVTGIEIVMISDAAGDTSGTTPLSVNARIIRDNGVTIVGNDGANFIGGTLLADAIFGNGGDDLLHGGGGDDLLDGGAGSDTYASFAGLDPVTVNLAEGFALDGDGGIDTLVGIENADGSDNTDDTLIGDAGANVLRGLTGNDLLEGGAGDDMLDGGAGADTMLGGPGDDTYVLDDEGDAIEESPNLGIDTVLSSVSTELRNHVEHLTLTGTAASGTGNRLDNVLTGNDAANALRGMAGDDTLRGGPGNDVLSGGGGEDSFVFADAPGAADADLVTDFRSGQDELRLDDAAFAGIGALGLLDDERFAFGDGLTAGTDPADRILYDTSAGNLYYDADGSGAGAALLFATLQGAPGLSADDIAVI